MALTRKVNVHVHTQTNLHAQVKAMNQYLDVSQKLDDLAYRGWFLGWKQGATQTGPCTIQTNGGPPLMPNPQIECINRTESDVHVPMCDGANRSKCSPDHYFGTHQIPMVPGQNWAHNTLTPFENLTCIVGGQCDCGAHPCGEYLFDFRNASFRAWFVQSYMAAATSAPEVDGLILDDHWGPNGPTEEDRHCLTDMGLSATDVADLIVGWKSAMADLAAFAADKGVYIAPTYMGDPLSLVNDSSACATKMREYCGPGMAPAAPHYFSVAYDKVPPPTFGLSATNLELDIAYFLVARGPYGWIGSGKVLGWQLSHWWAPGQTRLIEPRDFRPKWFDVEFGEPVEQCVETNPGSSGVFTRMWTTGVATVDCLNLKGHLPAGARK